MLTALFATVFASALPIRAEAPYNCSGRLVDFMPEGATWGMPSGGLPIEVTITDGGAKAGPDSYALKSGVWQSQAPLGLEALKFADGALTANVTFKNTSGNALSACRFDFVSATERYKGKDADGKEAVLTRSLAVSEDSPVLFGDLPKGAHFEGAQITAKGLDWKPETQSITVSGRLSGLTFLNALFEEHGSSTVEFDPKGRLLIGSGQKEAIYRMDKASGLESLTSTPGATIDIGVNPVDGTVCARWMNSHNYTFYSPGGEEKGTIEENDEVEGMNSWPNQGRYDGKGNLYLMFGSSVAQMAGAKPAFVLKSAGQYDFTGYVYFDVSRDGTIFVGSESNVFRFDPGGKNPKKILQGPDTKMGRLHGVHYLRAAANGQLWVSNETDGEFKSRVDVFNRDGKFIWSFGRGGKAPLDDGWLDGQLGSTVTGIAVNDDGRVFIACGDASRAVMAFAMF